MKNKHRKQIRDDMAILGVFQKLPYLLKSPKHRMSAYHSAKRLKIGIVIRESLDGGDGFEVIRVR